MYGQDDTTWALSEPPLPPLPPIEDDPEEEEFWAEYPRACRRCSGCEAGLPAYCERPLP